MIDRAKPIVNMLMLRRDVYLLASLLLADKKMASSIRKTSDWTQDLYENEVNRLMLLVATVARGLLDLSEESHIENQSCGEYWPEFPKKKEKPLTFRRACNSVIHAKEILPYLAPKRAPKRDLKNVRRVYIDRITIRGEHRRKTTRAQLNIIEFARITDILIKFFEEGSHANR